MDFYDLHMPRFTTAYKICFLAYSIVKHIFLNISSNFHLVWNGKNHYLLLITSNISNNNLLIFPTTNTLKSKSNIYNFAHLSKSNCPPFCYQEAEKKLFIYLKIVIQQQPTWGAVVLSVSKMRSCTAVTSTIETYRLWRCRCTEGLIILKLNTNSTKQNQHFLEVGFEKHTHVYHMVHTTMTTTKYWLSLTFSRINFIHPLHTLIPYISEL